MGWVCMSLSVIPRFGCSRVPPVSPREIPLTPCFWSDGTPIRALPAAWTLRGARAIAPALHLFDIEDETGLRSWFADRDGRLLGHRPDLLPPTAIAALRQAILSTGPVELHGQGGPLRLDDAYMADIVLDPLLTQAGRLLIRNASGALRPLHHPDGTPIPDLHPGWTARLAFTGFAPLAVLDLSHVEGHQTVWYVDQEGRFLGSLLHALGDEMQAGIAAYARARAGWPSGRMDHELTGYCLLSGVILAQTEPMLASDASPARPRHTLAGSDPGRGFALPPAPMPPAPPTRLDLHPDRGTDRLVGGWFRAGDRICTSGLGASLPFELAYRPTVLRVSLELGAVSRARQATVSLGGWDLATFPLEPHRAAASRRDVWIPAECLHDLSPCLELSFDPPDRAVACSLDAASLEIGPEARPVAIPPMPELMACFASLGIDCELGFVQRIFGAEPLGLFRFAGCDSRLDLLRLLETDFAGMGRPGSLSARATTGRVIRPDGRFEEFEEFYMTDRASGYGFHTWKGPADGTEAEALAANERKVAYLVRKTIEDLEDGETIWVYKDPKPIADFHEMFAIFHALGRKAPNRLFWITRMVEGRPPEAVEWVAPNLLRGYSDQSHHDAQSFDAAKWRTLCVNAYRAFGEREGQGSALDPLKAEP